MKPAKLRTYLLLLVLVASVPLVLAAVLDVFEDLEDARKHTRTTLRTLATTTVGNTGSRLYGRHESLERLATRRLASAPERAECEDALEEFIDTCGFCMDVFVTDARGDVTCATRLANGARREGNVASGPWKDIANQQNPLGMSPSYFDPTHGQLALMMSVPFQGQRSLHATLRLDVLDPHIPTALLPPETRFGFIAANGMIVWRNKDPEHLNATIPDGGTQFRMLEHHDGEFRDIGLDGLDRLFSVVPMPDTGWVGFIAVPLAWVDSEPLERAKDTARTAVLAILALVALGVFMARRITSPVVELQRVARQAQHGDLDARAPVEGPLELAAVAEALNALVAARRLSERELRAFLDNSALVAWMKDEQGRFTFVSDNFLSRFGWRREQVLGKTDADLWPPEVAARMRQQDEAALNASGAQESEDEMPNPDGTRTSWLTHKFRFEGEGRRSVGGLAVDITALKKAEAARSLADARLTQAFDASPIGMALRGMDDRFFRVNQSMCRMLGYEEAELLALSSSDVIALSDQEQAKLESQLLLDGKAESVQSEKRYCHKQGHEVWVQRTLSLVRDAKGQPLHFLAQLQDISEKKAAETSARLAVVGTLAAGAAHEINNPLTYILGNLAWVKDELIDLDLQVSSEKKKRLDESIEALEEAHAGAERIARIIAGLKTFSRKSDQPLAPTDVTKVMQSALKLTEAQRRNQARTETRFQSTALVKANPHQLEQVFINLLVNAVQAIPENSDAEGHLITVTVREAALGEVAIEIKDTGVGITDDVLPHIFEPFFTTKPVGSGTGLGLPTCHGIITSFHGRIEVESTPGAGSTFRVVLPALPATSEPAPSSPREAMVTLPAGQRVLVVDDDPAVAASLSRALRGGPEVVTLTDARQALSRIEAGETFAVVLCDLMMPTLSGEEFQRRLRELAPALAEGLIFLTGGAFTPGAASFLAATKNLCLQKPVETNVLRRAVAERLAPLESSSPPRAP